YDAATLDRLRFIKTAQSHGLSLREIGELLGSRDRGGRDTCRRVRDVLSHRLSELEQKREELEAFCAALRHHLDMCERALAASGVVGAGVAAFGARFAPVRPYFTGLSLVSLGYAFYQTYRPGPAQCDDGHCETPGRLHRRRLALFGITTLVLLLLTSSLWANWSIY